MSKTKIFMKETLEKFEGRNDWMGYGYLGGFDWRSPETDEILIAAANKAGITEEEFFQFCNSKPGRKLDESFEGKWENPYPRNGTDEEQDNWDGGEYENYWPHRACEECGLHGSMNYVSCEDCGEPTTILDTHKDLHEDLVKFLPVVCKELMEELGV